MDEKFLTVDEIISYKILPHKFLGETLVPNAFWLSQFWSLVKTENGYKLMKVVNNRWKEITDKKDCDRITKKIIKDMLKDKNNH